MTGEVDFLVEGFSVSPRHRVLIKKKKERKEERTKWGFSLDDMIIKLHAAIRLLDEHHREDGHGYKMEGKQQFSLMYGLVIKMRGKHMIASIKSKL